MNAVAILLIFFGVLVLAAPDVVEPMLNVAQLSDYTIQVGIAAVVIGLVLFITKVIIR